MSCEGKNSLVEPVARVVPVEVVMVDASPMKIDPPESFSIMSPILLEFLAIRTPDDVVTVTAVLGIDL